MTDDRPEVTEGVSDGDWDALADELDVPPFLRREWFESYAEAFGGGTPRTLAAVRGGRTVGVLPLLARPGLLTSPTNWHTPGFELLAADRATKEALVEAALSRARLQLELSFLDEDTARLVRGVAAGAGRRTASRVIERSPYLDLDGSFEQYTSRLDRHAVKEIARRRRRLAELGPVAIEVHDNPSQEVLAEFYAVEQAGWKGRQGTAVATDRAAARFYASVAGWAADGGWLRLAVLRVGERAIAADYCLEHGGRHYLLKTGYDEEFRAYGPGKLLRLTMIERAYAEGLTSYEFLGADVPWKAEWTSTAREWIRVQLFGPGAPGRAVEAVQVQGRAVVRSARAGVARWRGRR